MKKVTDIEGSEIDRHYLVKELYKQEDAEFRRDEFAEKIIQYGYLVVGAVCSVRRSARRLDHGAFSEGDWRSAAPLMATSRTNQSRIIPITVVRLFISSGTPVIVRVQRLRSQNRLEPSLVD